MRALLTSVALAALLIADASAQGRGRGRGEGNDNNKGGRDAAPTVAVSVVFSDSDRGRFRDYFAKNRIRPESLPPGIAKNVARGKPLPPGIAKKVLPADLLVVAPKVPGIVYAIVGPVVVAMRNDVVVDILENIF